MVGSFPAHAMFQFGGGRTGAVCHAADITAGVAGVKGTFTAFVLDSDIPALLSKGALESLRGCLDFAQHTLTLGAAGKVIPLKMSDMGHYTLSVADFPSRAYSASALHWAPMDQATQLMDLVRNGGFLLPGPLGLGITLVPAGSDDAGDGFNAQGRFAMGG